MHSKQRATDTQFAENTWYGLGTYNRSAKNRFGIRAVRIGEGFGDAVGVIDCINAGGNRDNLPLRADSFKFTKAGNTCAS